MKTRILAVVVLLALAFAVSVEAKEVRIISGYELNKYAIEGPIKKQLKKVADELREKSKSLPNMQPVIGIGGTADTTGRTDYNQWLSGMRSTTANEFLSNELPGAKIKSWPEGDSDNVREVRIEIDFVPIHVPPATKPIIVEVPVPQKSINGIWILATVIIGTGLTAFLIRKQHPRFKVKEYRREVGNILYVVPVKIRRNGLHDIPFHFVRDGQPVRTEDWDNAKKVIRKILEDPQYADQAQKFQRVNN